jgi:hypothetical protein
MLKPLVPNGLSVEIGVEYKINAKQFDFVIIAFPKDGAIETAFEFDFSLNGTTYTYYEEFFRWIREADDPYLIIYGFPSAAVVASIVIGVFLGCAIWPCIDLCRRNKISDTVVLNTGPPAVPQTFLTMYPDNGKSQEVELESMNSSHGSANFYPPK